MAVTDNPPSNTTLRSVNSYSALHVVKLGSSTVRHSGIFDEVADLCRRGNRVLLVSGGAEDIALHYAMLGRPVRTLHMVGGDEVRYCPPDEMVNIVAAYEEITLPRIREEMSLRGFTVFAATGQTNALVSGMPNKPARTVENGRPRIVRDHRAGTVRGVNVELLNALLASFDVVCLSPPVAGDDGLGPLNVDADVLAACLAASLGSDHLRLVTGTPGLLADPADRTSTLPNLSPGDGMAFAGGRMRQKVRAAELALRDGLADVAITGPHTLRAAGGTRFWRAPAADSDLNLLARMVEISSVSGDEHELADFLVDWCSERGLNADLDDAGNLVATRGSGSHRLLMLGHLDTVPFRWPVRWEGAAITGRGCVDAKASLAVFLETIASVEPPPDTMLEVIGTVEEERTAAGALYVRDHHSADAVIIGEPSGSGALTVSYHGVCKARLSLEQASGHTAGRAAVSVGARIVQVVGAVAAEIERRCPAALFAVLALDARNGGEVQRGEAVIDIRVPPGATVEDLMTGVRQAAGPAIRVDLLLGTPAVTTARTDPLVRAFTRAMRAGTGPAPRLLAKKGSSDMNTLATTWHGVPMVAYGPGDAALDHTPDERLTAHEYRTARTVLRTAVESWLSVPARAEPISSGARR